VHGFPSGVEERHIVCKDNLARIQLQIIFHQAQIERFLQTQKITTLLNVVEGMLKKYLDIDLSSSIFP
jgi:hypothetical protein